MFDHLLRAFKDRLLAPLARALGPAWSPALITILALVCGLGAAFAAYLGHDALALTTWLCNRVLDGLDGTYARVYGRQTDFGGYLDILLDFVVYASIPVALVARDPAGLALAGVFLEATFFVNAASWMYLSAILEGRSRGASSRGELTTVTMPAGIVAGTETVVLYALFLIVPAWRAPLFWLMGGLVCVNVVQRLWWARREL
jgi:phosphatidylglycerophosphate synthase